MKAAGILAQTFMSAAGQPQADVFWRFEANDGIHNSTATADVDGDSAPDVVAVMSYGATPSDPRKVYCLSGPDGSPRWSFQTGGSVSDVKRIPDVNLSGTDDCVAGGWDNTVHGVEGSSGALIRQSPLGDTSVVMELVPIRDLDGDGVYDVVVGAWSDRVHVLSGASGNVLWSEPVGSDVWSVETLPDVDGDGLAEANAGCLGGGAGVVKLFSGRDGTPLWSYSFAERVYDVSAAPDLNDDGRPEIMIGLQDHDRLSDHLYCLSGLPTAGIAQTGYVPLATSSGIRTALDGTIRLTLPSGSNWRLTRFDVTGSVVSVRSGVAAGGPTTVSPSTNRAAGVYTCRLQVPDRALTTWKLIVAR